jgi:hypothetical protein
MSLFHCSCRRSKAEFSGRLVYRDYQGFAKGTQRGPHGSELAGVIRIGLADAFGKIRFHQAAFAEALDDRKLDRVSRVQVDAPSKISTDYLAAGPAPSGLE